MNQQGYEPCSVVGIFDAIKRKLAKRLKVKFAKKSPKLRKESPKTPGFGNHSTNLKAASLPAPQPKKKKK